jgi:hypothetical protein
LAPRETLLAANSPAAGEKSADFAPENSLYQPFINHLQATGGRLSSGITGERAEELTGEFSAEQGIAAE